LSWTSPVALEFVVVVVVVVVVMGVGVVVAAAVKKCIFRSDNLQINEAHYLHVLSHVSRTYMYVYI
jgi:hypothetical protein